MNKKSFWKKLFVPLISLLALFSAVAIAIGFKTKNTFKPAFYNYKSYMSKTNIQEVSKTFEYKQFSEINEFTTALVNHRAVAGIGSDFQAVQLIKKDELAKINYSKLLNIPDLDQKDYGKALKTILRPDVWEHLNSYNKDLETDFYGNLYHEPRYLWQYFMPYYSQDVIIAYNILKNQPKQEYLDKDNHSKIDFTKALFDNNNDHYSMINIMKILQKNNYNNWVITDAMRDNMMYGSAYDLNLNTAQREADQFTGNVFEDTYKNLINNFVDLIQYGTGYNIKDTNHINFKGDGLELLNDLINPETKTNVAILYSGDGLDGHFSEDNFENIEKGTAIRAVRPSKNILMLDGLVISKYNSQDNINKYSSSLSENIYKNIGLPYKFAIEQNLSIDQAVQKTLDKYYLDFKNNELKDLFEDNEFEFSLEKINLFLDKMLKSIDKNRDLKTQLVNQDADLINEYLLDIFKQNKIKITALFNDLKDKKIIIKNNLNIDQALFYIYFKNTLKENDQLPNLPIEKAIKEITQNITNNIAWSKMPYYDEEYKEWKEQLFDHEYLTINNFDFINYVPVTSVDYNFIARNYFYNDDGTVDEIALDIYKISDRDKNSVHVGLKPVSDNLFSNMSFYYYEKTKS
ncbi:type 2 periplasmic-binding domain-containing protein [Mycoplasmopsis alligatoris]|uniref:Lipoprotein n=1 Tax=Mycoplasmopsis alligatoris A21JP2 TaxID=747682 RepID=D4XV77_9BACT|nr:hypothetical protein [Mycoplasmopsis alligatoris]EFF41749.1 conserved hypothetical protein [Mycoplasmopsis alligatoris A21JP2]